MRLRVLASSILGVIVTITSAASAVAHSAVEPAPRPDEWWHKRHSGMNSNAVALGEKAQVIFIGDSITQGWEGDGKDVWARHYQKRNALNLGIGGDRTQHVLWRLDHGNIDGLKPKAAVVMIGTNNSNGEDNTVSQIADGVAAIVRKLRERLPDTKVLLLPIFPRSENPSPQRGKVLQVNQIIQKLADEKTVYWIDFGHRFLAADGTIPRELMPDYLHLSPKAYEIWAQAIEPRLAAVLGETSSEGVAGPTLSGNWIITVPGPNQEPVELPFRFQQDGTKLTGSVKRPDGRQLEILEGRIEGNQVSWKIQRDRGDGTVMTYSLTGKLADGKLSGDAKTEMGGNPITIQWTGRRASK